MYINFILHFDICVLILMIFVSMFQFLPIFTELKQVHFEFNMWIFCKENCAIIKHVCHF